ncbi:hypothetical protein ACWIUH_01345 [Ursidibacter arcticus]
MKIPSFKSIFFKEKTVKQRIEPTFSHSVPDEHSQAFLNDELFQAGDDMSGMTISSLLGGETAKARTRQQIYKQWQIMEKDPVISIAIKTHTIAALGGHESKGDVIFIEENPNATEQDKKIIEELRGDLLEVFNKIAFPVAYKAIAFGDAYARTYFEKGQGLVRCIADEITHPMLVLPYEQGGETVGFVAGVNQHNLVRLTKFQIARMKMPRIQWIPQMGVIPKAYRSNIEQDDISRLPRLPSMVGGSFLFAAEKPFWDFYTSLNAIVGQRLVDSIDESLMTVNLTGSTKEQQIKFKKMITSVLSQSKELADKAMNGEPYFGRKRHVVFTHNEKQVTLHGEGLGSKRQGSITIDDIMLHARLLAGALGIDLSMLGFADQLSGGLGDGGFFRVSAQVAQSSQLIRVAMADFFDEIIDNHMLFKYGKKFPKGNRPYAINFYGSISAFEAEKQRTRTDMVGSAGLIVQTLAQMKDLGLGEKEMITFMTKQMAIDEDEATEYAKTMVSHSAENNNDGEMM